MTDEKADHIKAIVENQDNDIEMVMNKIDKIETKIKFKAFGKTKLKSKQIFFMNKNNLHERDGDLKQKESDKVERHIEAIRTKNHMEELETSLGSENR